MTIEIFKSKKAAWERRKINTDWALRESPAILRSIMSERLFEGVLLETGYGHIIMGRRGTFTRLVPKIGRRYYMWARNRKTVEDSGFGFVERVGVR